MFSTPRTAGYAAFPKQGTGNREQGTGKTHGGAIERFCGWFIPAWSGAFVLLALVSLLACPGCTLMAFPKEMGDSIKAIGTSTLDQGVLEKYGANVRGHIINPGVKGGVRITYEVFTNLDGVDGDVALNAEGKGNGEGLSDDARKATLAQFAADPTIMQLIERLVDAKLNQSPTPAASQPAESAAPAAPPPATP